MSSTTLWMNLAREFLADPRHHIVVALVEGVVVGVATPHQGKGIGKAIMKEMLQLGRQLDCVNAWVLTDKNNTAANGLYESTGGNFSKEEAILYEIRL